VGKGKKLGSKKPKKTTNTKNKTTEVIEDLEVVEGTTTRGGSKRKLPQGGRGSTPNKPRGTLSRLPQTKEHISLLVETLKGHTMVVWEDIDTAQ